MIKGCWEFGAFGLSRAFAKQVHQGLGIGLCDQLRKVWKCDFKVMFCWKLRKNVNGIRVVKKYGKV